MQNDGTVGVDLAAVDFFQLCRSTECPPQSATAQARPRHRQSGEEPQFLGEDREHVDWKRGRGSTSRRASAPTTRTSRTTSRTRTARRCRRAASTRRRGVDQERVEQPADRRRRRSASTCRSRRALRDRLFLTARVRTDQNSAFGTNFQQVYYPKVQPVVDRVGRVVLPEVRLAEPVPPAHARTARAACSPARRRRSSLFSAGTVSMPVAAPRRPSGTDTPALTANQPGNANLKPERSTELEGGFEAQLLNNRVHLDYTFWNKKTQDALININLAPSSAASQLSPLLNIGSTQGWGHEVQINAQLVDRRALRLGRARHRLALQQQGRRPRHRSEHRQAAHRSARARRARFRRAAAQQPVVPPVHLRRRQRRRHPAEAEVHVDSAFKYFGYIAPRDIISVQNGFDLFSRRLRINMMFDYKGGNSILDGANNFQCNTGPYACRDTQDPTASRWIARRPRSPRRTARRSTERRTRPPSATSATISSGSSASCRRRSSCRRCVNERIARAERLDARVRRAQPAHVDVVDRHRSRSELRH